MSVGSMSKIETSEMIKCQSMLVNIIICIKKDIVLVPRKTCKKIQKGETRRGYMRKKKCNILMYKKDPNCFVMIIFFCVNMFVTQISDISLQYSILISKSTE